jgi:putative ABC transport system permease protein
VASPIAWYIINQWLQNFPYRMQLNVWMFAITVIIAIVVAFATLSFQTFRTANANPVESLRSE